MARIILTAGKGGVGKSTVAAATAAVCAAGGARVLLMSIDSAHNLSDLCDVSLGYTPTPITDGLCGLEVDINRELQANWSAVIDFFRSMVPAGGGVTELLAEECAVFPGMEEVFGLMRLQAVVETGEFDVVVLDAPPTGDMLKFLRLPDVLQWFMEKYHPLERGMIQRMRPVAEALNWPVPTEASMAEMEHWYARVRKASATLTDHRRVSVRLVMTPDRVGLAETRRAFSWTCLLGMNVDGVVVNKVLPSGDYPPAVAPWVQRQAESLAEAEAAFSDLPILRAELRPDEVLGMSALREFGESLYSGRDPAGLWSEEPPLQWRENGEGAELRWRLPFLKKGEFRLLAGREGLALQVGTQRRLVPLPPAIRRRQMRKARYEDGWLCVEYGGLQIEGVGLQIAN
jgi:arsenite/tail-anchored protein-transporting ATPase